LSLSELFGLFQERISRPAPGDGSRQFYLFEALGKNSQLDGWSRWVNPIRPSVTHTANSGKWQCKLAISQLAIHRGHLNPVFRSTAPQTPEFHLDHAGLRAQADQLNICTTRDQCSSVHASTSTPANASSPKACQNANNLKSNNPRLSEYAVIVSVRTEHSCARSEGGAS
jgi:hypothetical protein